TGAQPLGRVIAVGGAQVTVAFSTAAVLSRDESTDVTVGTFLGISNGNSFIIGALCEVTLENTPDGGARAVGRMDLLGEIVSDAAGVARFHRGVMVYPRIGSAIVPIGNDELAIIFDVKGAHTIDVGNLQQNSAIGAYIDVDSMVRKHFAIFGSTGAGKSSAVALILRQVMEAGQDWCILLIARTTSTGTASRTARTWSGPAICACRTGCSASTRSSRSFSARAPTSSRK